MRLRGFRIPPFTAAKRRLHGIRTVASGTKGRPVPQDEFVDRVRRLQRAAAADPRDLPGLVDALWRSEGLATTVVKRPAPGNSIADRALPREALPVLHTGWGSGSAQAVRFDTTALHRRVDAAAPGYRGFASEGIGAMLRIYEPSPFQLLFRATGMVPWNAGGGPRRRGFYADFVSAFDADQQRLIVHGYGRLVGVGHLSVAAAVHEAARLPRHRPAAVQGIAFACAMINIADLPRLVDEAALEGPEELSGAFDAGLIYCLAFADWYVPGAIDAMAPARGSLGAARRGAAVREVEHARERGALLPFELEQQRPLGP